MITVLVHSILSKWFFVAYFALGIICFIAFPSILSWVTWSKSLFITLGLMTGSDPYSFKDHLESHGFVWVLAWLIHVASWLLIPALITLVVTEAKAQLMDKQSLEEGLREWVENCGVQEKDVERLTTNLLNLIYKKEQIPEEGGIMHEQV